MPQESEFLVSLHSHDHWLQGEKWSATKWIHVGHYAAGGWCEVRWPVPPAITIPSNHSHQSPLINQIEARSRQHSATTSPSDRHWIQAEHPSNTPTSSNTAQQSLTQLHGAQSHQAHPTPQYPRDTRASHRCHSRGGCDRVCTCVGTSEYQHLKQLIQFLYNSLLPAVLQMARR
jgi:hypothetical protein